MAGQLDLFRKRYPKARTGCLTCRQRHLKCDEARPVCRRCSKDQRQCRGYRGIRTMNFEILHDTKEKRSYHYFNENVAPALSGHHDQEFWTVTIKQVGSMNVAIQHAMAALGCLHEDKQEGCHQNRAQIKIFAFEQYNKAIRHLRKTSENNDSSLTFMVCFILFITIELHLGAGGRARKLLQNGLIMLRQWNTQSCDNLATTTERAIVTGCIGPMLTRFWLQVRLKHKTEGSSQLALVSRNLVTVADKDIAAHFQNVDQAKEVLQLILETTFFHLHIYASKRDLANLHRTIENGKSMLHSWKARFFTIVGSTHATDRRAILLLEIQSQAAELILRTVVSTRDLPSTEEFTHQVDLCEMFLQLHLQNRASVFFMDYAVIPALFFTAVRCPDAAISERALQLLQSNEWHEGFWSSRHVGNLARDALEEEALYSKSRDRAHFSGPESEHTSNIEGFHRFEGCAWELLGGRKLIVTAPSPLNPFEYAEAIDNTTRTACAEADAIHD